MPGEEHVSSAGQDQKAPDGPITSYFYTATGTLDYRVEPGGKRTDYPWPEHDPHLWGPTP